MRPLATLIAAGLVAAAWILPPGAEPVEPPAPPPAEASPAPEPDDDGPDGCGSGCGPAGPADDGPDHETIAGHLETLAGREPGTDHPAVESLLFHGASTLRYLEAHGPGPAGPEWDAWLAAECARQVRMEVRVVALDRSMTARIDDTTPFGEHFHFDAREVEGIQVPAIGGRVERTGLGHIWTRF